MAVNIDININWAEIQPAKRIREAKSTSECGFQAMELWFEVPLCRTLKQDPDSIKLHADLVYGPGPPIVSLVNAGGNLEVILASMCPPHNARSMVVYLCGGPGDGNPAFANKELLQIILGWGHPILFLDYRGTGKSTPVTAESLGERVNPSEYLAQFRQDSIVADLEAIRLCFNGVKFILVGQSFGGWIAMTYVSFLPGSLNGVFLTGGMPPIGRSPRVVYEALYKRVVGANEAYYAEYDGDAAKVKAIVKWLARQGSKKCPGVKLPDGQVLTPRGFMTLGRHFGRGQNGFDRVHLLVTRMAADLKASGSISNETLARYAASGGAGFRLPERPLYAVLHEAIYCSGNMKANWAAHEVGRGQGAHFEWLCERFDTLVANVDNDPAPLYFTGEMIHDFMLRDGGTATVPFDGAAHKLAQKGQWSNLYDAAQLSRNKVPIRALIYDQDMFVDSQLSLKTAETVRTCQVVMAPPEWLHGSIKTNPKEVCGLLFSLKRSLDG
jgi:pimeloyl-ACP methyl ester carboxylesterase